MLFDPLAVGTRLHVCDPVGVVQVPLHGFADTGLEGFGGLPAEFGFELARIDGVAAVVASAVGHVGDLFGVALAVGAGAQLVEQGAHGVDDLDVGLFVPAADVVGLTQTAAFEHAADGAAVVFDVEPVADLHAVAVHRQRLAGQGVDDHQRDEFFGEVERPVVVRAVGGEHRQAVGVVPCADQVVAGGLAGAVGAVGLVAVGLGKGGVGFGQRTVDLVGGDVQEAEGLLRFARNDGVIGSHRLQQIEGADDVGLDEVAGAVDGSVDVALGGEVHHRAGLVFGQQAFDQSAVADVALHKGVVGVVLEAGQGFKVACVGEFVEVDDGLIRLGQPVEDKVGADEAGCAGDENGHGVGLFLGKGQFYRLRPCFF